MSAIDFANSYMTWFPRGQGNIARIQLDAACTWIDASGARQTYYLIAPCRSERMYLDTPLFQMPNYEFGGVWGDTDFMIIRVHWLSERDNRQYGLNRERWEDVHLDVRTFATTRPLIDDAEIVKATLDNLPLIARTEVQGPQGQRAVLEYPVKTMNVMREPPRFQVDTGPLITPDFASTAPHAVERFDVAHIVYNTFDKAEFVLRRPTPLPEEARPLAYTTDYSVVQIIPAKHEIHCAVIG